MKATEVIKAVEGDEIMVTKVKLVGGSWNQKEVEVQVGTNIIASMGMYKDYC